MLDDGKMDLHKRGEATIVITLVLAIAGLILLQNITPTITGAVSINASSCGLNVTETSTMIANMSCTGDGLIIGADDIVIDCAGFGIDGDDGSGDYGIDNSDGFDNVTIKNCIITDFDYGIYYVSAENATLFNNSLSSIVNRGIFFQTVGNSSIDSNNVTGPGTFGIYLDTLSHNNSITNNRVIDVPTTAMIVDGLSFRNTIDSNVMKGSTAFRALFVNGAQNTTISNNWIFSNKKGLRVTQSTRTDIFNNTIRNNTEEGIFYSQNDLFNVTNNTLENNQYGLRIILGLATSDNNVVAHNTISNNSAVGLEADGFANTTIYNNFFNNTNNTFETANGGDNEWNTNKTTATNIIGGSTIGGNFYSDYNGTDNTGDGIGNTLVPYTIPGAGTGEDDYPLTNNFTGISCGSTINVSTTLGANLTCTGKGLVINNHSIIIDCDGYYLTGDDSGSTDYGIDNDGGYDNITIKNCNIIDFNDGAHFDNAAINSTFINNTFQSNTNRGIYINAGSHNATLINNTIKNSGSYGSWFRFSSNNTAINNTYDGNDNGLVMSNSLNTLIENNTFANHSGDRGIWSDGADSSNIIVNSNEFISNTVGALYASNNGSFTNNIFTGGSTADISLSSVSNTTVRNNTFSQSSGNSIYVFSESAVNVTIEDNTLTELGTGINVLGTGHTIENNSITDSTRGITVQIAENVTVEQNTILNNSDVSLYLVTGANHTQIINNTIGQGGNWEILIQTSHNNTFTNNTLNATATNEYVSASTSTNTTVNNLTFVDTGVSISFQDYAINLFGISNTEGYGLGEPTAQANLSKYINLTNNSADSWIFLNISYTDTELTSTGIIENTLKIWRYNGTDWNSTGFNTTGGVNTAANYLFANITTFSTFGAFGETGLQCGDTINTSTTLTSNLTCTGNGLVINSDDITIDCNGYYITGDGDTGDYGISGTTFDNITIKNCIIQQFGQGVRFAFPDMEDVTVFNNTLINNTDMAAYLQTTDRFNFSYNNVSNNDEAAGGFSNGGLFISGTILGGDIQNNYFFNNSQRAISGSAALNNISVQHNIAISSNITAIILDSCTYCNITNNTVNLTKNSGGMQFGATSSNTNITDNMIWSNAGAGIILSTGCDYCLAQNNTIINNSGQGVQTSQAENATITNNTIINSTIGIHLFFNSDGSNATNNVITGSTTNGIKVESTSYHTVTNNNVTNTTQNGINLATCDNVTLHTNRVEGNVAWTLIALGNCDDNLIYNNYFNNSGPITSEDAASTGNDWNTTETVATNIIGGTSIGGNFYGDYNGTDFDGDTIGDTLLPYNISGTGSGQDFLPLTNNLLGCGANITESTTLESTLVNSTGGTVCPDHGLIVMADDITIDCAGYTMTGDDGTSDYGINNNGYENVTVKNCVIDDFGIGIYFYGSNPHDSYIYNNTINSSSQYGIRYDFGQNSTIANNTVSYSVFDEIQSRGSNLQYNLYENNTLHSGSQYGLEIFQGTDNIVRYNIVYDNADAGLLTSSSTNNTFINNTAYRNKYGIQLIGDNHTAYDNAITNSTTAGIDIGGSCQFCEAINNTITGAAIAIRVSGTYSTIQNNTLGDGSYGLQISGDHNTYVGNTLYNNTPDQIQASTEDYSVFENNSISGGTNYALEFWNNNNHNTFTGNNITNAGTYGFFCAGGGSNNTLTGNRITGAGTNSIFLNNCDNHTIYNNLFNSTNDTFETSTSTDNTWNTTETTATNILGGTDIGGNFYSDFTGLDIDGDKIGDTDLPYNISGDGVGQDFLALTNNVLSCGSNLTESVTLTTNLVNSTGGTICPGNGLFISGDNIVLDCAGYNITYGSSSSGVGINLTNSTNVTIQNCNILKSGTSDSSNKGILLNSTSNSTIYNNTITSLGTTTNRGIAFEGVSQYNNITLNTITVDGSSSSNTGIVLTGNSDYNTIESNNISADGTTFNSGIALSTFSDNNTVFSNILTQTGINQGNGGLSLSTAFDNNITANTISAQGTYGNYGFQLSASKRNVLHNNTVNLTATSNGNNGVNIVGTSNDNNITYNVISSFGVDNNDGISIAGYQPFNMRVEGNNVTGNGSGTNSHGISITDNTYNHTILSNRVTVGASGVAIYLNNTDNNIIYNNFLNASNNTFEDLASDNTSWNITKTLGTNIIGGAYLGGNFYGDYNGSDNTGDGLGDLLVPYNISGPGAGQDFLPLTNNYTGASCGDTITTSTTLEGNVLNATLGESCSADGIVIGADDIVIDCNGYNITGDGGAADYGIDNIGDYNNVTIKNCNISSFGRGIYYTNEANGTIFNNTIENSTTEGITVTNGVNNNISFNTIDGMTINSGSANNITNNIASGQISLASTAGNIFTGNNATTNTISILFSASDNNTIINNNGTCTAGSIGLRIAGGSDNNIVTDNIAVSATGTALQVLSSNNNTLTSNDVSSSGSSQALYFTSSSNNTVTSNNATITSGSAIRVTGGGNNTFSNNIATSTSGVGHDIEGAGNRFTNETATSGGIAISISGADNNVTNSTGTSTSSVGILVAGDRTTLMNSIGTSTANIGIRLFPTENSTIVNVTAISSAQNAVSLKNAQNNTITDSTIKSNGTNAIHFDSSSGTQFFNTTLDTNASWITTSGASSNNNFTNTVFNTSNGSIRIIPLFTFPITTILGQTGLNITNNSAFVDSGSFSFLNTSAEVNLTGFATLGNRFPYVDFEDDGSFIFCPTTQCTNIIRQGTTLSFQVTSFTNYTSNTFICGDTINESVTLTDHLRNTTGGTICPDHGLVVNADDITIDCAGFSITGDSGAGDYGAYISSFDNVTTKNCVIQDFERGIYYSSANDGLVINNTVSDSTWCIITGSSTNNTIQNNTMTDCGSAGLRFFSSSDHTVFNNNVSSNPSTGYSEGGSLSNNNYTSNTAFNNGGIGFDIASSNPIIHNNIASNNTGHGFDISGANSSITNNIAFGNDKGILLSGSNTTVTNNIAYSNDRGIDIQGSVNGTVTNNTVYDNTLGFQLASGINVTIANNNASFNGHGINTFSASGNTLANNTLFNNDFGIKFRTNSDNNTIINNTINMSLTAGIEISDSDTNNFTDNSIIVNTTWITTASTSEGNNFTNTYFNNTNGSIIIISAIVPASTTVDQSNLNITNNTAFLNGTDLSFFNTTATITLLGIPDALSRVPTVDEADNGTFIGCATPQCTNRIATATNLAYTVTGFTSYSSVNDSESPIINITSVDPDQTITAFPFNITGNATDDTLIANVTINITGPDPLNTTLNGTGNWSFEWNPTVQGEYVINVTVTDIAAKSTSTNVTVTVTFITAQTDGGAGSGGTPKFKETIKTELIGELTPGKTYGAYRLPLGSDIRFSLGGVRRQMQVTQYLNPQVMNFAIGNNEFPIAVGQFQEVHFTQGTVQFFLDDIIDTGRKTAILRLIRPLPDEPEPEEEPAGPVLEIPLPVKEPTPIIEEKPIIPVVTTPEEPREPLALESMLIGASVLLIIIIGLIIFAFKRHKEKK